MSDTECKTCGGGPCEYAVKPPVPANRRCGQCGGDVDATDHEVRHRRESAQTVDNRDYMHLRGLVRDLEQQVLTLKIQMEHVSFHLNRLVAVESTASSSPAPSGAGPSGSEGP